jgi:nicotinamidase-related amidase
LARLALVIIDMLSDYSSPELRPWRAGAMRAARRIAKLEQRAKKKHIPVIYVNDKLGRWRSDARAIVQHARTKASGRAIVDAIAPDDDDYVLLKPKHSIFYATPLEALLEYIGARAQIVTGATSIQCALFSAIDAHVRDYRLYVPRDCIVSATVKEAKISDYLFRTSLDANTTVSGRLRLPLRRRRGV